MIKGAGTPSLPTKRSRHGSPPPPTSSVNSGAWPLFASPTRHRSAGAAGSSAQKATQASSTSDDASSSAEVETTGTTSNSVSDSDSNSTDHTPSSTADTSRGSGGEGGTAAAADDGDTVVEQISERLQGIALPPPAGASPPPQRLVDYRFQMPAPKINFITRKRCEDLWRVGLGLRLEPALTTIQNFLDKSMRTGCGRSCVSCACGNSTCFGAFTIPLVDGAVQTHDQEVRVFSVGQAIGQGGGGDGLSSEGGRCSDGGDVGRSGGEKRARGEGAGTGEGDTGGRFYESRFQYMTVVYCLRGGWVYLHHVTDEAVAVFRKIAEDVCCEEMGIPLFPALSEESLATLDGMFEMFNDSPDVLVVVEEAFVKIAGTRTAVEKTSRAVSAVVRSNERVDETTAHWYWRGDSLSGDDTTPIFPMSAEISAHLDAAYLMFLSNGLPFGSYNVNGVPYQVDFTLMLQRNMHTGFRRQVERLVTLRPEPALCRCPPEKMSLTTFREGTTYTLVGVSEEEEITVKRAVGQSYMRKITKVEHVWNSFLWGHYAQNCKSIGNENMLFHGASSEAINQICRTGFDRRLAGLSNGAAYGRGCYFARDASYAARYMDKDSGCQMLMAKVLVGEHCPGSVDMMRPPKLWSAGERTFDSTTDRANAPKIYVTYKDWQAYPMYVITFVTRSSPLLP